MDSSTGLKEEPNDPQNLHNINQDFLLNIKKEETLDFPDPPGDISTGLKEEPTDDQDICSPSDLLIIKKEEDEDTLDPPGDISSELTEEDTDQDIDIFPGLPSTNKQKNIDKPRQWFDQHGTNITKKRNLRTYYHHRHTGERPYHCDQCEGKSQVPMYPYAL